jgi:lysozyme
MSDQFTKQIKYEEGLRLKAYRCSEGKLTIGYGWNIDANPTFEGKPIPRIITKEFAEKLLIYSISIAEQGLLKNLPWTINLDPARRDALLNMSFQIGIDGLLKFKTSLPLIKEGKYQNAAVNLLKSLWAKQTPERAKRVTNQIASGKYYPIPN